MHHALHPFDISETTMNTMTVSDNGRAYSASAPNRFVAWLAEWRHASAQRAELDSLSDRELADIGIRRTQIEDICARPSLFAR